MLVCGIDIGKNAVAWALMDTVSPDVLGCGTWFFEEEEDFVTRLERIREKLLLFSELNWEIEICGVEDVWVGPNRKVSIELAKIWGVVFSTMQCPCHAVAPTEAKKALTGRGSASKERVMDVASDIIEVNSQHAADAIAVAFATRQIWLKKDSSFRKNFLKSSLTVTGYSWNVPIWSYSNI